MATKKTAGKEVKLKKKDNLSRPVHRPKQSSRQAALPTWMFGVLILIPFIAFYPALTAGFVNLDDNEYVVDNLFMKTGALKELLGTPLQGNYHPLTMLSLYFNYLVSGEQAWSYHLLNLILHIANCLLVLKLAFMLSERNKIIAFITALLFAIHPMRVESVAWISERKDVLYTLFFFLALIYYTTYLTSKSKLHYGLTIVFFILSLASKPAAVIFPVCLFSIDLLRKRKLNFQLILEKLPFFALAAVMGYLTMTAQHEIGATGIENFSLTTKILFGFYGIMMYILKLILPINLAVFYRYPAQNESLSTAYYVAPAFFVVLAAIVLYSLRKTRVVAFGVSFYLINLLLVLQVIPVGSAVMSERYTYVPYFGLFFIIGWLIFRLTTSVKTAFAISAALGFVYMILTWNQSKVWKDSDSLWDNAIKNQPSYKAYANRAKLFRDEKNPDLALQLFNHALSLNIVDPEGYTNRGNVYFDLKKYDSAQADYKRAIALKPDFHQALDNMGAQFAIRGSYDSALKYFNLALKYKPDYKPSYSNRGLLYMQLGKYNEAISDWQSFLRYEPNSADVYSAIGECYQHQSKYKESIPFFDKAIQLQPTNASYYLWRAISNKQLGNLAAVKQDVLAVKKLGAKIPADLSNGLGIQ